MEIRNKEHFEKVQTFAKKIDQADKLKEMLDRLKSMGGDDSRVTLTPDFGSPSPSFLFYIERLLSDGTWKVCLNGGLIFHGDQSLFHDDPNTHVPTFSVTLNPTDSWQIHT